MFSKFGDIAKINETTYIDCGRSLMNMQMFHVVRMETRWDREKRLARMREEREKRLHEQQQKSNS